MLPGAKTPDGALYITTVAPQPTSQFWRGMAVSEDGALHVTSAAPQQFIAGFGVMNLGALAILPNGIIASYHMGLPMSVDGRVVTQAYAPPQPGDSYVAGLRVGGAGVYTDDTTPVPPTPWSSGFSEGFGNGP